MNEYFNSWAHSVRRSSLSDTRTRNAIQRSLRCLGERGFALLTGRARARTASCTHWSPRPCAYPRLPGPGPRC